MDFVIRNARLDRTGEAVEVGIEDGVITVVVREVPFDAVVIIIFYMGINYRMGAIGWCRFPEQ